MSKGELCGSSTQTVLNFPNDLCIIFICVLHTKLASIFSSFTRLSFLTSNAILFCLIVDLYASFKNLILHNLY